MKALLFANTGWYLFNFRRSMILALRDAGFDVLLTSPPDAYVDQLRELGVRWVAAPMQRRSLNPLRELSTLIWLRQLMLREQVDIVHGFTIKCAVYGSLAGRLAGVRGRIAAVTGMGYVYSSRDMKAGMLRPLIRCLMRMAFDGDGVRLILQNRDDVAFFEQARLIDPARIDLIPGSGIDCDRFKPPVARESSARSGTNFRVLLATRLLWDKGLSEYVAAARQLAAEGRSIDFLLAGDPDPGNPAAVPEATVRRWADEGSLQWLGNVTDMPALLQTIDCMVLPSYREGLPKGLVEGGACGLPLITTDVPGCRDVVTNGVNGLLVPAKDAAALAAAIAQLQDDPDLRMKLGGAARKTAVSLFDERIVIERTIAVYRKLAAGFDHHRQSRGDAAP